MYETVKSKKSNQTNALYRYPRWYKLTGIFNFALVSVSCSSCRGLKLRRAHNGACSQIGALPRDADLVAETVGQTTAHEIMVCKCI
jgi:hypothetical protein